MSKQKLVPPLIAVWFIVTVIAMCALMRYGLTPGAGASPTHAASRATTPASSGQFTLLMFVHPKCPCSSASIAELAQLMARYGGRVTATVYFYRPLNEPDSWCHSNTWLSASETPGVNVAVDADAHQARAHGAQTSGQVLLFDKDGRLEFEGGITVARGHEGDNDGLDAVVNLLSGNSTLTLPVHHPVFGCAIYSSTSSNN